MQRESTDMDSSVSVASGLENPVYEKPEKVAVGAKYFTDQYFQDNDISNACTSTGAANGIYNTFQPKGNEPQKQPTQEWRSSVSLPREVTRQRKIVSRSASASRSWEPQS